MRVVTTRACESDVRVRRRRARTPGAARSPCRPAGPGPCCAPAAADADGGGRDGQAWRDDGRRMPQRMRVGRASQQPARDAGPHRHLRDGRLGGGGTIWPGAVGGGRGEQAEGGGAHLDSGAHAPCCALRRNGGGRATSPPGAWALRRDIARARAEYERRAAAAPAARARSRVPGTSPRDGRSSRRRGRGSRRWQPAATAVHGLRPGRTGRAGRGGREMWGGGAAHLVSDQREATAELARIPKLWKASRAIR